MKYCLVFITIIVSIISCRKEIKHAPIPDQTIDSVAIMKNSIRLRSEVDSLVKHKKTLGGIACGTKFSREVDRDSSDRKVKSTLYYFPTNSLSETTITSYFADEKMVFVSIKHSTDLWKSIKFEQNIYVDDSIQIEESVIGNFAELPTDVQQVIINTL